MPAEDEGASKVCGLCSNLVDKGVKLDDDMLEHLVMFLNVQGQYLPMKMCTECFTKMDECKNFMDKCRRNVEKLKNNKLSTSMVLGRSREEVRLMKLKFKDQYDDLPLSVRSKLLKRQKQNHKVKKVEKVDPDLKKAREKDDNEEIFPSVGPYQCEICQKISHTKQEFVDHIKALHRDIVDSSVLRTLEADLRKRKKKGMAGKKGGSTKKKKKAPKRKPKKKAFGSESDEDGDDDDDYRPSKKKKKREGGEPEEEDDTRKVECQLCGTKLRQKKDLNKHQTTDKCKRLRAEREVAGVKAATEGDNQDAVKNSEGASPIKGEPVEGESEPANAKVKTEIEEQKEDTKSADDDKNEDAGEAMENSNEYEQDNPTLRQNSLDAKFKANIAKRYEAEIGTDDQNEHRETNNDDRIPNNDDRIPNNDDRIPNNDDRIPNNDDRIPNNDDRIPNDDDRITNNDDRIPHNNDRITNNDQQIDHQINQNHRDNIVENAGRNNYSGHGQSMESMITEGGYNQHHQQQSQNQNIPQQQDHQSVMHGMSANAANSFKPWAVKDPRGKETTIDFSSIEASHLSSETVEDIESQMAALHDNGIGNRTAPWDM